MFDARAVLGIVLYFKEKVLKPLRKDGYLNWFNLPKILIRKNGDFTLSVTQLTSCSTGDKEIAFSEE